VRGPRPPFKRPEKRYIPKLYDYHHWDLHWNYNHGYYYWTYKKDKTIFVIKPPNAQTKQGYNIKKLAHTLESLTVRYQTEYEESIKQETEKQESEEEELESEHFDWQPENPLTRATEPTAEPIPELVHTQSIIHHPKDPQDTIHDNQPLSLTQNQPQNESYLNYQSH